MKRTNRVSFRSARGVLLLAASCLILASPGCYPGEATGVEDFDIVLTIHDDAAQFSAYQTFAMPDSVVHDFGEDEEGLVSLPRDYDELILQLAESNMTALGYTREPDPEQNGSDLFLTVSAIGTSETGYWYSSDWWYLWGWYPGWGYYPGYGPGWGYYYPPGFVGSVTVEQGTVILTLTDPNAPQSADQLIPVLWSGAIRGLLHGGAVEARITSGINQAFTQSPYLGR